MKIPRTVQPPYPGRLLRTARAEAPRGDAWVGNCGNKGLPLRMRNAWDGGLQISDAALAASSDLFVAF